MAKFYHKRTIVASVLKIGISRNTTCDNMVGFPKSGHNYILLEYFRIRNTTRERNGSNEDGRIKYLLWNDSSRK